MVPFNLQEYPYHSKRTAVCAKNGMVAASQPLASQAGLDMLKKGGNAVDAALAAAACLTIVEPTANGIGSDAFALVWDGRTLHGINGSGPAPMRSSAEVLQSRGMKTVPKYGWGSVTVPGAPALWAELSQKFGSLTMSEVFAPAVNYGNEGFPVSPVTAQNWKKAWNIYRTQWTGKEFLPWFETFAPGGTPPEAGSIWKSAAHAETLRSIAETHALSFYQGEIAEKISLYSEATGGLITKKDLNGYRPEWVKPLSVDYQGYEVWEMPPNTQGIITLMALNMLKGFDLNDYSYEERYHLQVEALKLAFADGLAHITQDSSMEVPVENLLSESYADERRKSIRKHAALPRPGLPAQGGTVYLAAADSKGMMVSFIQSNYMGFGSGVVVPKTGVALQNRGHAFSLNPSHVNCLKPGKKPYHTIIPGFLTQNGSAVGPFGVMGGFMQPQGHLQIVMNLLSSSLNPQAALDAPRWQWTGGKDILLEHAFSRKASKALKVRGHNTARTKEVDSFGRGQIIWKDPSSETLIGGTEPRTDGCIAAW